MNLKNLTVGILLRSKPLKAVRKTLMTGQLALTIRFLLYPFAGMLVTYGIMSEGSTDAFVGSIAEVIAGVVVYIGTIIWSRVAKSTDGGAT